jgi:hypothetical protein
MAQAPFSPVPDVPDYVVTIVEKRPRGDPTDNVRTVTHHGEWTRIDVVANGRRSTSYINDARTLSLDVAHAGSGAYAYANIVRDTRPRNIPSWFHRTFKTGERQVLLGESCEVWDIRRWNPRDVPPPAFSCVTDDGIELWHKDMHSGEVTGSFEVTNFLRRSVQADEVRPPSDLLELKSWTDSTEQPGATVTMAGAPPDFETMLRDRWFTRITRRHHPWAYTQTKDLDVVRKVSIVNDASGLHIDFEADAGGDFMRMSISKAPPGPHHLAGTPVDLGRKETVLGEECTWFDMLPRMMDAGLHQCRTPDGIVLKEQEISRGSKHEGYAAVQLQRREVGPAEVLPPSDILKRETWGIPE